MRTKTLNQIAQEAAKYAVEALDIERALVVKQARAEERLIYGCKLLIQMRVLLIQVVM